MKQPNIPSVAVRSKGRARASARSAPRPSRGSTTELREAILETARALYARGGYDAVTMGELAHELGIKPPSIYHHFPSKEAIFRELQRRTLAMLHAQQCAPFERPWEMLVQPWQELRQYYLRYYEFSAERPDQFRLLFADPSTPPFGWFKLGQQLAGDLMKTMSETAHAHVRRCIEKGLLPRGTNVEWVAFMLWSTVHGVATVRLLVNERPDDRFAQLAAEALDAVLEGLRAARKGKGAKAAARRPRVVTMPEPNVVRHKRSGQVYSKAGYGSALPGGAGSKSL